MEEEIDEYNVVISSLPFSVDGKEELLKKKRTLDFSSALVYNLLRKVLGIEVSDCPQYETIKK